MVRYLYVRDFVVLVCKKNYYGVIYWNIDNNTSRICDSVAFRKQKELLYRKYSKLNWNLGSGLRAQGKSFKKTRLE